MLKTKYIFLKRLYKDTVIIFKKNNTYYSMGLDNYIRKYPNVNYLIIEDLEIIKHKVFKSNEYKIVLDKVIIKHLISRYYR